jgi:hypothetical protein
MRKFKIIYVIIAGLLTSASSASGQASVSYDSLKQKNKVTISQLPADGQVTIQNILLFGNKVTKEYIVLREVSFSSGTVLPVSELMQAIEKARQDVLNTQLFLEVLPEIIIINEKEVEIKFVLKERWYIFPIPYFKMVDRNINQWIVEQNASLERVNYGLKFNWENVSGRRDKLSFRYINGYNRQFLLSYEQPFADRNLEKGFLFSVFYTSTRQASFATDSNKQVFYPSANNQINDFVRSTFKAETGISYRKGVKHRHYLRFGYVRESIADTITGIIQQNTSKGYLPFFTDNKSKQNFGEIQYNYQYYDLDNIPYPLKGFAFNGSFLQRGLGSKGMNLWQFYGKAGRYIPLGKTTYTSFYGVGTLKLPFNQPMYNMQAMGYGDLYMQGLEYYVIDGVMAGMLRTTIAQELFKVNIPTFFIKDEKYKKIPFRVLAKVYANIGGSYSPFYSTGVLNNRLLYTYGAGVDILSYYDFTARIDYSFNQLGEKGLFLHVRKDF